MKKIKIIVLIVVCVILSQILPWFLLWGTFTVGSWFVPKPPEPEITYGEFPFVLEYEVDGVYHKYEDILVCEYKGASMNMGSGEKERNWTAYYKSKNEQIVLYKDKKIEIFFFPVIQKNGNAYAKSAVLMGDMDPAQKKLTTFPDALYKAASDENGYRNGKLISADKLLEEYNIRLISWDCAPPIKNTFK